VGKVLFRERFLINGVRLYYRAKLLQQRLKHKIDVMSRHRRVEMERTLAENWLLEPKYNDKLIELYHPGTTHQKHLKDLDWLAEDDIEEGEPVQGTSCDGWSKLSVTVETAKTLIRPQSSYKREIHFEEETVDLHKTGTTPSITEVRSLQAAVEGEGGSVTVRFLEPEQSLPPPNSLVAVFRHHSAPSPSKPASPTLQVKPIRCQ